MDKKGNQSANANEFNTSLGWSYLMDQVIAPLFSASVDMGKKAVVASSAAAVGALGAGALALAAPGVVSGASALLTKGTAFVAENGPGLLASINNPANYGKAFLLGAGGNLGSHLISSEAESFYGSTMDAVSNGIPSEATNWLNAGNVLMGSILENLPNQVETIPENSCMDR